MRPLDATERQLLDQALAPILETGERLLYRAYVRRVPRAFWKQLLRPNFQVPFFAVVTNRRLILLPVSVQQGVRRATGGPPESTPLAHIKYVSAASWLHRLTIYKVNGERVGFEVALTGLKDPLDRAFAQEMPARVNSRQLPSD